jgi:uncharacterized protein (DUF2235 family)
MKRLIVCCDGTWQQLESPYPTNVVKMAQAIQPVDEKGIHQLVYYGEGIGTDDLVSKVGGGAFGWGIDNKIQDAYCFLCLNYEDGDEIYLFGFSRGAYTVRCLAGLIYCSGLLQRQFIRKIPEAYDLYRDRDPATKPSGSDSVLFRQSHGENVFITALGCWDTVGSLGIPDLIPDFPLDDLLNKKYEFFDTTINRKIQKAFHATAIDEIRKVFNVTLMESSPQRNPDQVTQVWFPGTHGCVGGGIEETRGLSDAALIWMMQQVEVLGLALDKTYVEDGINPKYDTPFDNSPQGTFKLTGTILREIKGDFSNLHDSVKERWQDSKLNYRPENLQKFQLQLNTWNP